MDFQVIIMAAGLGRRMSKEIPKFDAVLYEEKFLQRLLKTLSALGIKDIIGVFNRNHREYAEQYQRLIQVKYQEEGLNGTLGAVKSVLPEIKSDSVLIIPIDIPLIKKEDIARLIQNKEYDVSFLVSKTHPQNYGVVKENNKKIHIIEPYQEKGSAVINVGFYFCRTQFLRDNINKVRRESLTGEYPLTKLLSLANSYNMIPISFNYTLTNINDKATLSKVERTLIKKKVQELQKKDVTFENPHTVYLSPSVILEPKVFIGSNVIIRGNTQIMKGSSIMENTVIEDSIIGEETRVRSSYIDHSKIGSKCEIGPFSHLRGQVSLGDNVTIGNFCELKNSSVGSFTLIKHHAYIGDAKIGSYVNIASGVITANYNGYVKEQTIIKDNSFSGCNVNLIAPVTIGANCFVAAGSTVVRDLEDNSFYIERGNTKIKQNKRIEK